MPGPVPIPVLGEFFNIIRKGLHKNDTDLVRKYGQCLVLTKATIDLLRVHEGNYPEVLLSDPELLRQVLIKDAQTFLNRRSVEGVVGPLDYGLTQLKDEQWKNARTIVSPTCTTAKLRAMFNLMDETGDRYNTPLCQCADRQEMFNIRELTEKYTWDNIASCLFGIETNSLENEHITLVKHLKKFAAYLNTKGYSILPKDVTELIQQILIRRRQHLERRNDFIQIMVDHEETSATGLKRTLNDRDILGQALIFLFAGYETTNILISFVFYVLATQPTIQEKVLEEIQQEIGDNEITSENIHQPQYLDMVISETLRMYPPVIRFDRVSSQDYDWGNYRIPKGILINVPIYPTHHDPDVWPEPERFIPERFSPAEKAKRHSMTYLPFGDGPRNCIGMRFALLEAKVAIARALRVVEVQSCEKTEIPIKLSQLKTLIPKQGIWIRVSRRSHS